VEAFEMVRRVAPDLVEIPEIPWNRLSGEMKANIRLGLVAGECVRPGERPLRETSLFAGVRVTVALASVGALMVTGLMLERPVPIISVTDDGSMVVQATANGIQVRKGGQELHLNNPAGLGPDEKVLYAPNAQGAMRARYVDPKTGYVMINNVYVE
jgi:hypothetical protein